MDLAVERRIFERIDCNFSGTYLTEDAKEPGKIHGLNVGGAGMGVWAENKIPEEKAIELRLSSKRAREPITTTGRVVWQREVGAAKWIAGVKFYQPNFLQLSLLIDQICL